MLISCRLKYSDLSREWLESISSSSLRPDKLKRIRDLPSTETGFIVHTPDPEHVHIGSISSTTISMLFTDIEICNYCLYEGAYIPNIET